MDNPDKTAIIIGGSLAGLMHALALKAHFAHITILEADPSQTREGLDAGIRAGPEVIRFIRKFTTLREEDVLIKTPRTHVVKQNGKDRLSFGLGLHMTSWGLLWRMLKSEIDNDSQEKGTTGSRIEYRRGSKVTAIQDAEDMVLVSYTDVLANTSQTISANFVVAADGAHSTVRSLLLPDIKREYAGYVSWRGTIAENQVSEESRKMFEGHFTMHFMKRGYIVCYIIPTDTGLLTPNHRLLNWVWYHNVPAASLSALMTDTNSITHSGTVPRHLLPPKTTAHQHTIARAQHMNSAFLDLVLATPTPFVTKIQDVSADRAVFMQGKVVLVGDALCAFRPHIALSTNQAARHCLGLSDVLAGAKTLAAWEKEGLQYARKMSALSVVLGTYGQEGWWAFLKSVGRLLGVLARQAVGGL